ncbi:MAG: tetratricopeptide repeat protein [Myxococcota bacterium]
MSKSIVEKYEQMLSQDPASTVFVELARAYLERGDNDRAMTVCEQGINHHPNSVVGRVLWGKALINKGKAADAMKQFDLAVNIDRENPHAYNLISEALLRKGLFRSALPILRKAAALQPNDARIAQWLEQTRAALSGGPAPVLYDSTTVGAEAYSPGATTATDATAATSIPDAPTAEMPATRSLADTGESPTAQHALTQGREERTTDKMGVAARGTPEHGLAPSPSAPARGTPAHGVAPAAGARGTPAHGVAPAHSTPARGVAPAGAGDPDVFASFAQGRVDPQAEPTVVMNAYTPTGGERPAPPVPTGELPVAAPQDEGRPTQELPAPAGDMPLVMGEPDTELPPPPDPFASVPSRTDSTDTFRGLTSTFDALAEGASPEIPHVAQPPRASAPRAGTPEPSVIPAADLSVPSAPQPAGGGLLDDVVSAQSDIPTGDFAVPGVASPAPQAAPRAPAPRADGRMPLLEDIPDDHVFEPASSLEVPRVEFNTQATEAIAKEYERELRAKLEVTKQKKTFLQKHGLKLAVLAIILVVGGGLVGSYAYTSAKNQGETLQTALAKGISGISADTREQYEAAVKSLDHALSMEDGNVEALAHKGYAQALLYAEHTKADADRQSAMSIFQSSRVREAHPEFALVVDALTAAEAEAAAARQQLLGSELDKSVVHAEAGRRLLADKKYDEALARLKKAIDGADTTKLAHVRALVALGDYYLGFEDWDNALEMFSRADALSRFHPARVVGHAEARLELSRELPEALSDLEGLTKNASVPDALKGRYTLMLGRAQSANGKHDDALKTLAAGQAEYKALAFEYAMGLGQAARAAGKMDTAQKTFEEALKLRPKSEDAKEGLGRVLLARSREKELLDRLKPERDARKVALLRGIAFWRLGDPKRARAELANTQVSGKYPAEAVVYLALTDAAEEAQADKAVEMLEKLATSTRKNRATVQVALARVYMQRGALDKAKAQLEEAAKDPADYEGNALLGELLLNAGLPPEVALEPLQRAVDRNGSHAPSRHLLTRTLLAMGRTNDAVAQVEAWTQDNPTLEQAWRDAALTYLEAGKLKDAEAAVQKVPAASTDVEGWRVRARILFARGDGRGAMTSLEKANKLNARDAETFCEIGNAFVRQGNNDTAAKAYEAALREDPRSVCGQAGPLHARPTTKNKAKQLLTQLIVKSSNAWEKGFLQATLARVHLEERNLKEAAAMVDDAMQSAPHSPFVWYAAAEVAKKQKEQDKARDAYAKTVELDASWSAPRLAWADALARQGGDSLPKAIAEYETVLTIDQNEADQARVKKTLTALKKQLEK